MSSADTSPCICRISPLLDLLVSFRFEVFILFFTYMSLEISSGTTKAFEMFSSSLCPSNEIYFYGNLWPVMVISGQWTSRDMDGVKWEVLRFRHIWIKLNPGPGVLRPSALPLDQGRSPRCGHQMDWRNIAWPPHLGIPFMCEFSVSSMAYWNVLSFSRVWDIGPIIKMHALM